MSDEISGPHPIKFGRANTMSLTESGWVISIKNADGTSDEVVLEPKFPEVRVERVEDVEKVDGDGNAGSNSSPPKPSRILQVYLFVQYFLNAALAIIIITIMALTLAKYNATKHVPGAWPQNPVTSPTLVMMIVIVINCLVDSANLLVQCCSARTRGVVAGIASKVRNVTGVVTALAPAAAVAFSGISTTTSNNGDLWSWSCSSGADKMADVNSSGMICMTNQTAFALQICQILFQILSILVPALQRYRPASSGSKAGEGADKIEANGKASKSAQNEKTAAKKSGDEAAQNLIHDAGETFKAVDQTWGAGSTGVQ